LNFSSSFFSLANEAINLIADKDSSTTPPNFFTIIIFAIVTFLTYVPNSTKVIKITGTNAAQTPAKSAPLYMAMAMPLNRVVTE
jgi:hypothetical protein